MRLLSRRLVPVLLLAAPLLLHAQALTPATRLARAVDAQGYRAHLEFLASDLLEGRGTGTRGGELAAAYIATQFKRLGLAPAGDSGSYYHRVPIIALTPEPTLKVTGPAPRSLSYRDDYVLWSMRNEPQVNLAAGAVFAGYGIVAPEAEWNDYAGLDVKGKVVFVLVNDPGLYDESLFKGKILTYYGRWTYKIEEAQRQGAAGIVLIHTTESATYPWTTVTGSWTGEQVRLEQPAGSLVVAGWMKDASAEAVFKAAGVDLRALMQAAGKRGFRGVALPFGLEASVKSTIRRSETFNVLGRLPGRGRLADEAVLIDGHYDHFGIRTAVNGDSIYNGAEDNASGTAAVLAMADAFVKSGVQPLRSIVFMGVAAEESGLIGSQAYAANPTIPLKRIAAMLNVDVMNLYGRTRSISALGIDQSSLGDVFTSAAAAEGLRVTVDSSALLRGSFFRSDHFSLVRVGVPALSIERGNDFVGKPAGWGEEQGKAYNETRYHQPQDEVLPWFSMDGVVQQMKVVLRTAIAVANAPGQPTWKDGSEFKAAGEARLR